MDNKRLIIICGVILIISSIISAGVYFGLTNQQNNKHIIYNNTIDGVGTFNTTNVTNFTLGDRGSGQTDYIGNDSITQISIIRSSYDIELSISEAEKVNDSVEGHSIYKNTANVGEHKGDVRYFSVLKDNDNQKYVFISSDNYNLTCMMVDSFKFL